MIEIPYLNGESVNKDLADAYCSFIRELHFDGRKVVPNNEPHFNRTSVIGCLIYTNAHIEFVRFINNPQTWHFLDSITGKHFHMFSLKPDSDQGVLSKKQLRTMAELQDVFELQEVTESPSIVLFELTVKHKNGREGWEHVYKGHLGQFETFTICGKTESDYIDILRRSFSSLSALTYTSDDALTLSAAVKQIAPVTTDKLLVPVTKRALSEFKTGKLFVNMYEMITNRRALR